jgi:hypothetical protein
MPHADPWESSSSPLGVRPRTIPLIAYQSLGRKEDDRTRSRSPNPAEEKKSGSMPFRTGAFAASVAPTVSAQESASSSLFPKIGSWISSMLQQDFNHLGVIVLGGHANRSLAFRACEPQGAFFKLSPA